MLGLLITLARSDYLLALEWGPTVCLYYKSCPYLESYNASFFNIHGLWPENSCKPSQNCTKEAFNSGLLSADTKASLQVMWVGLFSDSNSFHSHEWSKHGTCYITTQSNKQNSYFQKAVLLNKQFNLVQRLVSGGIKPSDTTFYSVNQITAALRLHNPFVSCKTVNGKQSLYGVYICLNVNFQQQTCPCPVSPDSGQTMCKGEVFFPQFHHTDKFD